MRKKNLLPQSHRYYIIIINAVNDIFFYNKLDAQQFQDDRYHDCKMQQRKNVDNKNLAKNTTTVSQQCTNWKMIMPNPMESTTINVH